MTDRSNIFLSHASPEDNEFTRWLASKLILSGYKVWYDLEYLKGGEYFWKKIENVIRNESIRLIAILSENSYKKDGVRNEWDLGIAIENYIPNFVIPVFIDGFNSRNLPINLYQKNCIEFSNGWHKGLVQLLDTLDDAQIIKQSNVDPVLAKACLPNLPIEAINWVHRPEILESNWFNIVSLPPAIETTEILGPQREIQFENETRQIPWFEFGNKIIGFAPRSEIVKMFKSKIALSAISAIDTETFLNGQVTWGDDKVTSHDAFNRVGYLIQQAWDLKMEKLGLISYELSNNKLIWYVPFGLIDNNKMEFKEWDGERRKKQLAGTSGKYKVNWHYAISMQPILFLPRRIQLQAHIVFTDTAFSIPNSYLIMNICNM